MVIKHWQDPPDAKNPKHMCCRMELVDLMDIWESECKHKGNSWSTREYADGRVDDGRWFGKNNRGKNCKGMDDIDDLVRNGWHDGRSRAMQLKQELNTSLSSVKIRRVRRIRHLDEEGDDIDIDKYMNEDYENMWETYRRDGSTKQRYVTLVGLWGGLACRDVEQLQWMGITMVVLSDMLERAGYVVECVGANGANSGYGTSQRTYVTAVTLKKPDQRMDTDAVLTMMAHAGVFRTYGFRAKLEAPTDIGGSMGSTTDLTSDAVKKQMLIPSRLFGHNPLVLPPIYARQTAVDLITKYADLIEKGEILGDAEMTGAPVYDPAHIEKKKRIDEKAKKRIAKTTASGQPKWEPTPPVTTNGITVEITARRGISNITVDLHTRREVGLGSWYRYKRKMEDFGYKWSDRNRHFWGPTKRQEEVIEFFKGD